MENWILEAIRRCCRRRIAFWALALAALAGGGVMLARVMGGPLLGHYGRVPVAVFAICSAGLLSLLLRYEHAAWQGMHDPASHPVYQRILSWGDAENTAAALERELRAPRFRALDGWQVTDTFLVQSNPFTFDVHRIADVRAARTGRTWHWKTGHLPFPGLQAFFEVVVLFPGQELHLEGRRKNVERIRAFMEERT